MNLFSKNMKKLFAIALASGMLLSACAGGGTNDSDNTADSETNTNEANSNDGDSDVAEDEEAGDEASNDMEAELTYGLWDEKQQPFIEEIIAAFNEEYPNISVQIELTPYKQYWQKLKTQAEGNNLPDVFWMNGPNSELYAAGDQLASLDDTSIEWDQFPESLVNLYSNDGHHYGVPKDFDTIALWYNSDLFSQAGVEVPTDDWTWDDFNEAANTISEELKADGVYGVTADLSGGQESFYNTMLQAGGYVIEDGKSGFDDPKSIEGLKFWSDLIATGAMPSVQVMSDNSPNDMFISGKAAMIWAGTWMTSHYADEYPNPEHLNLVKLPKKENKATVIHGLANVVAKSSENLDAAKAFATFLGSKEAAEIEGKAGTTLPAYNGTQGSFLASQPDWNLAAYTESAVDEGVPYPVSANTSAWAGLEAEILTPGFAGDEPIEESAKKMADAMNEKLAAE